MNATSVPTKEGTAETPKAKPESRAQREAKREAEQLAKARKDPSVAAIQADLEQQSIAAKDFNGERRVPRREFDADGNPASNPRTRKRSAN